MTGGFNLSLALAEAAAGDVGAGGGADWYAVRNSRSSAVFGYTAVNNQVGRAGPSLGRSLRGAKTVLTKRWNRRIVRSGRERNHGV
jgi:predicted secreted Zn-dependent protease